MFARLPWRARVLAVLGFGLVVLLIAVAILTTGSPLLPAASATLAPEAAHSVPDPGDDFDDFGEGEIEPPQSLTTQEEWDLINAEVARNLAFFETEGLIPAQAASPVKFEWPLRAGPLNNDDGYHGVSGFTDHNPAIGARRDYNCGTRSYDLTSGYNHQGTDYFTYPFGWLRVDTSEVEVIAAAPGVLSFKRDGQFDRNCAMGSSLSNAVVIRHDDGSTATYLHMKRGSVTAKPVGSRIAVGEYLGVVASSGSSTGPHLHFEIKNSAGRVIDPYEGPCNQIPSMWRMQPPYYDSHINRLQAGLIVWKHNGCANPESPNIQDSFAPNDRIVFTAFYRDRLAGQESVCRIYRPDNTVFQEWTYTSTVAHSTASYAYWTRTLGASPPAGTWRFEVTYQGQTHRTFFNVGAPTFIEVTMPKGGEVWTPGTLVPLIWQDNLGGDVRLELLRNGALVHTIEKATPADGVHFWYIPADMPTGDAYKLRITNITNPSLSATSPNPFTLSTVPEAGFHATPLTGMVPLTVVFTDASTGAVTSWRWNFGDGNTSTERSPTHTYANSGVYTVVLKVDGPLGSDEYTRTEYVTATTPPLISAFQAYPMLGLPPLSVTFTDRSSGPPRTGWHWNFGDGTTSTEQNPRHTYAALGTYTVTLRVNGGGEQVESSQKVHVVAHVWRTYLPLTLRH
jgi:PKD repeat protein/murein DD-endopeptidase MepM/ murein hydrolase activator NlpD